MDLNKLYKLVIFDVDGTLVETKSGEQFRKDARDWQWLPGRKERLQSMHQVGVHVALATNQGGVAFGYLDRKDTTLEIASILHEAGLSIKGLNICFTHPNATKEIYRDRAGSNFRKPGPGMLHAAMGTFNVEPEDTLMVGDRPEDEQAAKNAGVDFEWAKDFFGDSV